MYKMAIQMIKNQHKSMDIPTHLTAAEKENNRRI